MRYTMEVIGEPDENGLYPMYDRLIEDMIILKNADPNGEIKILASPFMMDFDKPLTIVMGDKEKTVNLKAVNNYNIQFASIEHADNVNIDVRGAVKDVLGFVGEQMKESREERREFRKEQQAASDNFFKQGSLKIFVIMFSIMIAAVLIVSLISYFTGGFEDDATVTAAYEDDSFSATATPLYYSVVKVTVEDYDIVDATDPVIVDTLSEYDFDR